MQQSSDSDHDMIKRIGRRTTISTLNSNPCNWEWNSLNSSWAPATDRWRDFSEKWYGATENQFTSPDYPGSPSLTVNILSKALNSYVSKTIFIRESYVTLFDTVWAQAIASDGTQGVIVTGQPGTGKSLFIYYLLARLLQRKQVILFSPDGNNAYLFYFGNVYTAVVQDLANLGLDVPLPESKSTKGFVWSIFDIGECKEPATFLVTAPCCPIQSASPDPVRYKRWEKVCSPLFIGLPLWSYGELVQGLKYQRRYKSLSDALTKIYESGSSKLDNNEALDGFPFIRHLIRQSYEEENMLASPGDVFEYMLQSAIFQFGYAARDVYSAIFNVQRTNRHEQAVEIGYEGLHNAILSLSQSRNAPSFSSHKFLAISPIDQGPLQHVKWKVSFKSDWISRMLLKKLGEETEIKIKEFIGFLRNIPEGQALAGRMLEPLAHHGIPNPKTEGGFWTLLTMNSNNADPPQFSLSRDSTVPDGVKLERVRRNVSRFQSVADLQNRQENNGYYIPADPNFPLVDAFIIDCDREKKAACLWAIQITTSKLHKGSKKGYEKIREIVASVYQELLDDPPQKKSRKTKTAGQANPMPVVEVRYVLVVSKDSESQSQTPKWQFPKGWSENHSKNDHRGNVFCLQFALDSFSWYVLTLSKCI